MLVFWSISSGEQHTKSLQKMDYQKWFNFDF